MISIFFLLQPKLSAHGGKESHCALDLI
jgi:hypothetical protein